MLATLIKKTGSSYRKEGAMMFIAPSGETIGALSGGCLEKDIVHQAHRLSFSDSSTVIEYDSTADDYTDPSNNTGCSGKIQILLVSVTEAVYQQLLKAQLELEAGQHCIIQQCINHQQPATTNTKPLLSVIKPSSTASNISHSIESASDGEYSVSTIAPRPRLMVIGAGHDAIPICSVAASLGWYVYLWDERIHTSHYSEYQGAAVVDNHKSDKQKNYSLLAGFNAVILKSHNLSIDAFWLSQIEQYQQQIAYIGLLGPKYRKGKVIEAAELQHAGWAQERIFSPAGLEIGGDTAEAIALSILSQVQRCFTNVYF
ncbi:XdhC family protein [Oceanicoccus sagamiensis]|uniref:Xanthine dehydrogenase n=1 Tax=Oceanicoccus sagamiensis TaxID=716816 RepID=A0A1X9NLM9_9GAMM|nr:XdhC/CoxI family protein [Oceanicoccus sagamiensis]ARN75737.1 hypothetical protein BST96_17465 [Oceanicoccus sagamiensis]